MPELTVLPVEIPRKHAQVTLISRPSIVMELRALTVVLVVGYQARGVNFFAEGLEDVGGRFGGAASHGFDGDVVDGFYSCLWIVQCLNPVPEDVSLKVLKPSRGILPSGLTGEVLKDAFLDGLSREPDPEACVSERTY